MALKHLTDEQVRTWTREQKDRWWLTEVFRGDLPQLTWRSGLVGFLLGGILAATNLYIGAKTGIQVGVNLTSVILTFAFFRLLSRSGVARDFTILENNATQSATTAAGYAAGPFMSSLVAYMLVTGVVVPAWQMMAWSVGVALLGVLLAFPLKRRFVNDEQMPFPEGRAAGVVLDALYGAGEKAGLAKARALAWAAGLAGGFQLLASDGLMRLLQVKILRMDRWAGLAEPWHLRERIDEYYYLLAARHSLWIPRLLGSDIRQLGLRLAVDFSMIGVGGLMGLGVSASVFLGTVINFGLLAPLMIRAGDIAPRLGPDGVLVPISRSEIVNQWSLWWAVSMMVVGSLVGLLARPGTIAAAFRGFFTRKPAGADVLGHIEVPLWVSFAGAPVVGIFCAWMAHTFFGAPWLLALAALPLIFVLSIIVTQSMALTSWMPTGAMAKITQFTIGAIDRTNPGTNLSAAGMTSEVTSNAASLLSDIKPGYMLGAKPRQQALAHVIGILSGSLATAPLFYLLFLPPGAGGARSTSSMVTDAFPFPAALQWKGVSELIARGLQGLPASAVLAMAVAAGAAAAIEAARIATKGRFPLSSVSIGLGVVLPPDACLGMFAGALFFWFMGRRHPEPGTPGHERWVESLEPICAGLITGAALVGIGNALVNALL